MEHPGCVVPIDPAGGSLDNYPGVRRNANLCQLLQTLDPQVAPARCKIHLAVRDGNVNPLDEYLAGNFDKWQWWQNRMNFERDFVLARMMGLGRGARQHLGDAARDWIVRNYSRERMVDAYAELYASIGDREAFST